jgi:hypothetical protein
MVDRPPQSKPAQSMPSAMSVMASGAALLLLMLSDFLHHDFFAMTIGGAAFYLGCCITSRKSQ